MAIMDVAILLAVISTSAYFRVSAWVWTLAVGVVLVLLSKFTHPGFLFFIFSWLLYLNALIFTHVKVLRLRYFTRPLIKKIQKLLPSISDTEREAINAGDVWWEKDLFCGRPDWKKLLALPKPTLAAEEESFINNQVETLCTMLDDWQIFNNDHDLTPETWAYLKKEKFFGMAIPKEYGGLGFSALAHSAVVTKIASRSVSAAVNAMVPNSLGPGELLVHYGTQAQKDYYLPRLAKGEEVPCFALTGPDAGSDAGAMTDIGIVCRGVFAGKKVIGIRLTWDKRYITLAPVATVLGLAFRLYDPEHLLGSKEDMGITLCLVPTSHPGVEIGHRHLPLHLAFMNGPTRGKDVFIPADWIIGGVEQAGQGWRMLMECLSIGRGISLPALSTACGKLAFRTTGAYARIRKQFNLPIASFEGVEEALGNIAGLVYTLEASRIMTAGAVDLKIRPAIASAIAKYHMTEMGRQIMNHAMDIHGGHAIQTGPRNFLAHMYTSLPMSITVEGANILTRNLIIFGQGAIRCHPYILQEVELLSSQEANSDMKLDKVLLSHMGYVMSNVVRNVWLSFTGGRFVLAPVSGRIARYYQQLTRMSSALALLADVTMMLLGGNLKRRERISARLGDVLSELYLASTVLKYYQDQGKPAADTDFVCWSAEMCLYRIQIACDELFANFPQRWLGKLLSWLIFPYGVAYRKPSDVLHQKIANAMLAPSDFRDRITQHCFVGRNTHDAIRCLETAFEQRAVLDDVMKKLQLALKSGKVVHAISVEEQWQSALAQGVLTASEIQALRDYHVLEQEVIKVNEFSFDLKTVIS